MRIPTLPRGRPPMRLAVVLVVGMSSPVSSAVAQSNAEADVVRVIDAFRSAMAAGDSTTALTLLSPDVTILEGGNVETLTDYRSGHLRGDMRFEQAVTRERGEISVTVLGDVAWAHSTSVTIGRMGDREIDSQGAELMVLARRDGRWLIEAIHWSSRSRR